MVVIFALEETRFVAATELQFVVSDVNIDLGFGTSLEVLQGHKIDHTSIDNTTHRSDLDILYGSELRIRALGVTATVTQDGNPKDHQQAKGGTSGQSHIHTSRVESLSETTVTLRDILFNGIA